MCLQQDSDRSVHSWILIRECSNLFEGVDVRGDPVQNRGGV